MTGGKTVERGWVAPLTLLLFLSILPFLLPKADAIPETTPPSAERVAARPHARVVVFIVDGLGYAKAVKGGLMPRFVARIKTSAFGTALASFPTITPTGLRGILSGHRMIEPQLPTGAKLSPEADSIMARAAAAGLKVFAVGQFCWPPLFPGGHGAQVTVIPYNGIVIHYNHGQQVLVSTYDMQVLHAAEPVLRGTKGPWDLLVLHLFESDPIAHSVGTRQPVYDDHLKWVDMKIDELSTRLQAEAPTTLVMVADHGQADDGSHGGLSRVERHVPFMMWGAGVKPGKLGTFPLYNAAPTLAALLGVSPPAMTEGWPMVAGLQVSDRQKADIMVDLLRQRTARWQAFLAVWPWIGAKRLERGRSLEHLYEEKKYAKAASAIMLHIRVVDQFIEDSMPEKWLWRLIAALWLLVFAACFGLAWHEVSLGIGNAAAGFGAAILLLTALPLLWPGAWGWGSELVLVGSAAIAALTMLPGLRSASGMEPFGWALLWFALFGIAFQVVLDVSLWSWFVLLGLFVGRAMHLTRRNAATTVMSLAAVAACGVFVCARPSPESSLLRSLAPGLHLAFAAAPDWRLLDRLLLLCVLGCAYVFFVRSGAETRRWRCFVFALSPLVVAYAAAAPAAWLACLVSLAAYVVLRPAPSLRGMWVSAAALAYYRTLAPDMSWGILALAVLAGWGLAWESRDAHPLWEGVGLLCIGLWSYECLGGDISFSHVSVEEGFRTIGGGWHPVVVLALMVLKYLAAVSAPILPRLATRSRNSVLGVVPLVGALGAGNLMMIWWDRFQGGAQQRITDHVEFTRVIFGLILVWIILILWLEIQALDRLSLRFFGRDAARGGA
ncbi:MAG: alkaline phosphatase family protein [Elusimicrobiota bacterium]